jgi:tetratricopeptide (TPR) repeat protein
MPTRLIICSVISCLICIPLPRADAQKKGDRIVVSADVYTKIKDKKVDQVVQGEIDTIIDLQGNWCALSRSKGWLPLQYVMSLDMAEKHFTKRIEKDAKDHHAWAIRGMVRFEFDRYEEALKDLNESIRLFPTNPVAFNNRGIILNSMHRYPEALVNLNQAIKLNPDYPDALENRGLVKVAMGQYKDAIEDFDLSVKGRARLKMGENPWTYVNRGSAKSNAGDYTAAKTDFLQALKLNKEISDAYIGLSVAYLAENNIEKAFQFADEALKKNSRNGLAFNQRGWTHYKLNKIDEAIHDFDQAIRHAPQLSIVYNNRGMCHTEKGQHDLAIKDLNRAVALNPRSAVAYTNRGTAYMAMNKFKEALADFKKAVELSPKLTDAANGLAWFLATCPQDEFRNGADAVKHATTACELSQWKDWSCIDTLAAAHAENGQFEKAVEMAQKALESVPDESRQECENRLALFQKNTPYRGGTGKSSQGKD